MTSPRDGSRAAAVTALAIAVILAGAGLWVLSAVMDPERAWRALLVAFLLFTPMAVGLVVWPAIVVCANGRWSRGIDSLALGATTFAPLSLVVYAVLWAGQRYWAPWAHAGHLPQGAWLDTGFVLARNLVGLLVIWGMALWFARQRARGRASLLFSGGLVVAYCLVFSLVGFDLVMALDPHWVSSLFGGYFFITGLYGALVAWALLTAATRPHDREPVKDLALLLVGFGLLSTYLMYSHLLLMWYENLPHEVRFLIPRQYLLPWQVVSAVLLGTIYLGPLILLLPRRAKRSPWWVGGLAVILLCALWLERLWLVAPSLHAPLAVGLAEISSALALAAALALGAWRHDRRARARAGEEGEA